MNNSLLSLPQARTVVTAADVESFLLDLCRKGSTPSTRNVNLAAVRCLLVATTGSDVTASIPRAKSSESLSQDSQRL